jgi:hypothetical protein
MLYLTCHLLWHGAGDFNVHESGRDEDDDGAPDVDFAASLPKP